VNDFFRFKQFIVRQGGAAMKVGVDSVLLGAWVDADKVSRVFDVGSGTGLLALMMAQRYPDVVIDAIEIDEEAHQQAMENVANSPWDNRICLFCNDFFNFSKYCPFRYDLIISNPPYFTASLKPSDSRRNIARHNDSLPIRRFVAESTKLLTPNGMLAVVLPPAEAFALFDEAGSNNLLVKRTLHVQTLPSKPVYRIFVELSKSPSLSRETRRQQEFGERSQTLCIEKADRSDYTDEYKQLTRDFYLKF